MLRKTGKGTSNNRSLRSDGCSGCRDCPGYSNLPPKEAKKIVLAGNPNVGKSVVFSYLTGRYAEVSNYPGTTVEISRGEWRGNPVSDTPGIYGLTRGNDEERLAEEIIEQADIIVNVVDATRLRRDLFLTLQLQERAPLVLVVNMMDEARRRHQVPDLRFLASLLGVPVVPAAAIQGEGMDQLIQVLCRQDQLAPQSRPATRDDHRSRANKLYEQVTAGDREMSLTPLDRWLTRPLTGIITGIAVLALIWWVIGSLVADKVVGFSEGIVMNQWLLPPLTKAFSMIIPGGGLLDQIVLGDFGLLTMVLGYGLGLLLPLVLSFYLLLALLEDSGYMPRLAVLLDNTFRPLGLNGKAVIPLILGFGCVTMALISTRVLSSRRERVLMAFLLGIAVPCSAQTGIIAIMLVPMGLGWLALYAFMLVSVFLLAGMVLNKLLPGRSPGLFLELPPVRLPRLKNIGRKAVAKSWAFLKDALPLFALGSVLITVLDYWGILASLESWLAPLTTGWLGLPRQVLGAFIMGMIRRDFGAAGLHALALPNAQCFVALITMTLFVPCVAALLVIIKEHGWPTGLAVWVTSLASALLVGGVLAALL